MKTPRMQLARILTTQLDHRFTSRQAVSWAAYLLEHGRTSELGSLVRDVQAILADRGVVEVVATSAHPLDAAVLKRIETEVRRVYPEAKHIPISTVLNPEVVGGVRIDFVGYRLDMTVSGELQKFKAYAVHGKEYL